MRWLVRSFFLLLVLTGLCAPSAYAHDQLTGSVPASNAVVQTSPESVELTFNNDLMTMGTEISVKPVEGGDSNFAEGEPQYGGQKVTQKLKPGMPEGSYNAAWRVVSSDGHPIGGVLKFSVGHKTEASAAPEASEENKSMNWLWPAMGAVVLAVGAFALWFASKQRSKTDV